MYGNLKHFSDLVVWLILLPFQYGPVVENLTLTFCPNFFSWPPHMQHSLYVSLSSLEFGRPKKEDQVARNGEGGGLGDSENARKKT